MSLLMVKFCCYISHPRGESHPGGTKAGENRRGKDTHVELNDLEPLPLDDLIVRLTLLYKHVQEHPVADEIPKQDLRGRVDPETVETLCEYLYYADQSYDCGTEANLKDVLSEKGYELNFAKLEATWAEHCPAYFVATHPEEKELLITVRGTAQIEDVITDLTALPTELEGTDHLVHGGILASAVFLRDRLYSLSQAMHGAGFRVTLVGHSLGAGAAVLLSIMFKNAGMDRVRCFAFATPNCVDRALSGECASYVTSVLFRDDIVARFSPEALAGLHRQLLDFDLKSALEEARKSDDMLLRFVAFVSPKPRDPAKAPDSRKERDSRDAPARVPDSNGERGSPAAREASENQTRGDDSGSAEGSGGDNGRQDARNKAYRPHVPGRVLYIYRKKPATDDSEQEHELAFVNGDCPALRCIRLSDKVVTDHLIDSYFQGFGRKNPSKVRAERIKDEQRRAEAESESSGQAGGEEEPKQSADDRDKEAKDKWRPWKAKLGLVS